MDINSRNINVYQQYAHEYNSLSLNHPEQKILKKFKNSWHKMKMLDIGVGGGRTAFVFSALVDDYVGIDYASNMIAKCKSAIGESENVRFEVSDARDMRRFYSTPFDFILFSMNGIDSVDNHGREQILSEVKKVLKPGGYFFFSTHTLATLPHERQAPDFNKNNIPVSIYKLGRYLLAKLKLKWIYRSADTYKIKNSSWYILKDSSHDFNIDIYHTNTQYLAEQLDKNGFKIETVFDTQGREINLPGSDPEHWVYVLCSHK